MAGVVNQLITRGPLPLGMRRDGGKSSDSIATNFSHRIEPKKRNLFHFSSSPINTQKLRLKSKPCYIHKISIKSQVKDLIYNSFHFKNIYIFSYIFHISPRFLTRFSAISQHQTTTTKAPRSSPHLPPRWGHLRGSPPLQPSDRWGPAVNVAVMECYGKRINL